ncbi:MAG: two-component system, NarL family, capsular synthesis sensor histidine kinase RcsC [Gaiellaceae bacterium]|jgi:CheY-like chemotaxis protein|nr:two-component system, NarL family, capsular synthesis sensor histidine kinase RcsC [Gaiellaceae bacterium]
MKTDNETASILLVEDHTAVRELLREALERAGYACTAVGGWTAAVAELRRSEYQLVLADVELPGVSGLALAETLRNLYPSLPVLLISGSPEYRERALQAGARAFLLKPSPTSVVVEHVRAALAGKSS